MSRPSHSTDKTYAPKNPVRQDSSGSGNVNEFGSLEIDLCDGLLRIHNDVVPGGVAVVQLIPNCGPQMRLQPAMVPADIVIPAGGTPVAVQHNVGIYPVVQVINTSTGAVDAAAQIVHNSTNQFTVTPSTADPHLIAYRF